MSKLRVLILLAILVTEVGCNGSPDRTQQKPLSAQSVALQQGDVAGMQRCSESGDVNSVIASEKATAPAVYGRNLVEWLRWKQQGATEAYFAVYGRTPSDCAAMAGAGAPSGGLVAGLVVKFKDAAIAAKSYQGDPTLLGFGPKDILFIQLAGGVVTTGSGTGLGPDSKVGVGLVAGSNYYFAFWQKKSFESDFFGYNVLDADADRAVRNMNSRIH
jgi:hypothetical protein